MNHSTALDALLLNAIGFANAGTNLLGTSRDNLVASVNTLEPTTNLLFKYSPEYTCFLQGTKWYLDNGGYSAWGGADGRTLQLDVALLLGNDPYVYPDNLPIVAAKGGPGRKAGVRVAAGRHEELPGARARHQHRLGNRARYPAQLGHRASLLRATGSR